MIFSRKYTFESCYSDKAFADNASIFEVLTSVSKAHTETAGITLPEGIVWMVLDWKLRINRRPKNGEICTVSTWVSYWNKAFCVRCFYIIDGNGHKCAEAASRWVLVNRATRRMSRMTADIIELCGIHKGISSLEQSVFIKNISKDAVSIESCDAAISGEMIDENNHVHNTVYSLLAERVLPKGVNTDSVDISYRKEIDPGEKLTLDYCRHGDGDMVLIRTKENQELNAIILFGSKS